MNIKDSKEQIKNAMKAYFAKDDFGNFLIPIERQRPVFLIGAPGIGKTAVMEQIAQELGVGLVSYSITHHTRQSALGLPFIVKKTYDGEEFDVSEYTMSEIIASVYDVMEQTGIRQGILFLDEINCVSETLAPAMLQFLQYKIFGRHRVPDNWIVVTAGNPPEYNKSVREFDIVTWDRLKRIDVEPDFDAWKEFAYKNGIHGSVMSYLEIKKNNFYCIESTVDGKTIVTPRGWDDLSRMIRIYEQQDIVVSEKLVSQYLQNHSIAKDFTIYYSLYNKYKADYKIDSILEGKASAEIKDRAKDSRFDERLSLLGLLLDRITNELREVLEEEETVIELINEIVKIKSELSGENEDPVFSLNKCIEKKLMTTSNAKKSGSISLEAQLVALRVIEALKSMCEICQTKKGFAGGDSFKLLKSECDKYIAKVKKHAETAGQMLSNIFLFVEEVFENGQESLILTTELTLNYYGANFISRFGCKEYFEHNKELLFYERQRGIISQLEALENGTNIQE